jgi:serine/threonine protein phosphatase PrpC
MDTGPRSEQVVTFAPGSFLVLFTDGLVERRGETFDDGLGRLVLALAAADTTDPASLCQTLAEKSLPPAGRTDDTAILCAYLA